MNKLLKKTIASILVAVSIAGIGSVTASAVSYRTWSIYQNQGAPTSNNKYTDTFSGVATGYTLSVYVTSCSLPSGNYFHVYCSNGISVNITETGSYLLRPIKPGESFMVTIALIINDHSYPSNAASGYICY